MAWLTSRWKAALQKYEEELHQPVEWRTAELYMRRADGTLVLENEKKSGKPRDDQCPFRKELTIEVQAAHIVAQSRGQIFNFLNMKGT